ncbi:MAG TPA: RNA methyltransferase [Chryseolinea sp.]
MHPLITSAQNPKIKNIIALEKSRERARQNLFVIEGVKELALAVEGGYKLNTVFFCPEIIGSKELQTILKHDQLLIPVEQNVFSKIAYRESTGGVIALGEQKQHRLENIKLGSNPLILVLEGVEKPGNLGAVLRTADAAALDAVVICDPRIDFYNPNVIRSSVGCVFTNQIASASTDDTIGWLQKNNVSIYCTYLKASKPYHEVGYTKPSAIIMGTEAVGLSDTWVRNSNDNIIIPMQGKIDSMNVSTAAAVVVFEACRQRSFRSNRLV